jgi:hypothetical protein
LSTDRDSTVPERVARAVTAASSTILPLTSIMLVISPFFASVVWVVTSNPGVMPAVVPSSWLGKKAILVSATAITRVRRILIVGRT